MKKDYINVNGIPSYVLKIGEVEECSPAVLVIPGNPGVGEFYIDFMKELTRSSEGKLPVWCVSHAGHVTLPAQHAGDTYWEKYSLKQQIQHKISFIENHIPKGTKLFLIGHSIGAYMVLHLLEYFGTDKIVQCYMMFPTVERLGQSPGGRKLSPVVKFHWLIPYFAYFTHYLPSWLKHKLVSWYERKNKLSESAKMACLHIFDPSVVRNMLYMANIEFQHVNEADHHIIEKYQDKLIFYYGETDHYTPIHYYEGMRDRYPNMKVHLDQQGTDHAFVLQHSEPMAEMVWKWISSHI